MQFTIMIFENMNVNCYSKNDFILNIILCWTVTASRWSSEVRKTADGRPLCRHTHGRSANGNLIFPYYFLTYTSQQHHNRSTPLTDGRTQTRRRPPMKCGHVNSILARRTAVKHNVIPEYETYILHYGTTIRGVYLPSAMASESIMTLHLYTVPAVYQQYHDVYNNIVLLFKWHVVIIYDRTIH